MLSREECQCYQATNANVFNVFLKLFRDLYMHGILDCLQSTYCCNCYSMVLKVMKDYFAVMFKTGMHIIY